MTTQAMALKGVSSRDQGLLEAAGLWGEFRSHRTKLLDLHGNAKDASVAALQLFLVDGEACKPALAELEASLDLENRPAKGIAYWADGPPDAELAVAPLALAGKEAMEPEIARWVARNIDNPEADPATCPDPFAWTLLRLCRENPAICMMFVKDIWTKLLTSQMRQGDEDTGGKLDGAPTLELIQRIRVIRDESRSPDSGVAQLEACRVHSPEVVGSTPTPAIQTFDDFDGEAE